jgi:hypothetical protein
MKVLLDRWQFGVTITYHFLFVRSPSFLRHAVPD